jgi:hypothetical protein
MSTATPFQMDVLKDIDQERQLAEVVVQSRAAATVNCTHQQTSTFS